MEATHCNHDITFPSWSYDTSAHGFRDSDALGEAELLQVDAFLAQCDDDGCVSINNEASFKQPMTRSNCSACVLGFLAFTFISSSP